MPRPPRTEATQLLQEVRAIELLASEVSIAPHYLQAYWDLAADLITLVAEIEELQTENLVLAADDPVILALRRRLRTVTSRLGEIAEDF